MEQSGGHTLVISRKTYAFESRLLLWVFYYSFMTSYCYREPTPHYLGVVKTLLMAPPCLCPPLQIVYGGDEESCEDRQYCDMDGERVILTLQRDC